MKKRRRWRTILSTKPSTSSGRQPLYEKFPIILELIEQKFELADSAAHNRRRDSTAYIDGVSLKELKTYIEDNLKNKFNVILNSNTQTYRRYLMPPHMLRAASLRYRKLIDAKIFKGENDISINTEDQHWARVQITYIYSLLSNFGGNSLIMSIDDKAKADIGKTAVSNKTYQGKHAIYCWKRTTYTRP